MQPKPKQWSTHHAAVFQHQSVARAYGHRPPYPAELFHFLHTLGAAETHTILDLGCGPGDLARELAPLADRVDAVDISQPMIEIGKTRPGGAAPNLRWICAPAETAPLRPPYTLITAGDSLHWMDWGELFPRLQGALAPGGVLAIVGRGWGARTPEERAIFARYSTNQDFRPLSLVAELEARGLFQKLGEAQMPPAPWRPTVDEYIESRHSQSAFSRERMTRADVGAFDAALRTLLRQLEGTGEITIVDGRLQVEVRMGVTWGLPVGLP